MPGRGNPFGVRCVCVFDYNWRKQCSGFRFSLHSLAFWEATITRLVRSCVFANPFVVWRFFFLLPAQSGFYYNCSVIYFCWWMSSSGANGRVYWAKGFYLSETIHIAGCVWVSLASCWAWPCAPALFPIGITCKGIRCECVRGFLVNTTAERMDSSTRMSMRRKAEAVYPTPVRLPGNMGSHNAVAAAFETLNCWIVWPMRC